MELTSINLNNITSDWKLKLKTFLNDDISHMTLPLMLMMMMMMMDDCWMLGWLVLVISLHFTYQCKPPSLITLTLLSQIINLHTMMWPLTGGNEFHLIINKCSSSRTVCSNSLDPYSWNASIAGGTSSTISSIDIQDSEERKHIWVVNYAEKRKFLKHKLTL